MQGLPVKRTLSAAGRPALDLDLIGYGAGGSSSTMVWNAT